MDKENKQAIRCFFAINLDTASQQAMQHNIVHLKKHLKNIDQIHWTPPHKLHVTLHFIAALDTKLIQPLIQHVTEQLQTCKPFQLTFKHIHYFSTTHHRRFITADVTPKTPLQHLVNFIHIATTATGLTITEKKFHPHITLARIKCTKYVTIPTLTGIDDINMDVRSVSLLQSQTEPEGAVYTELHQFMLQG